MFGKWKRRISSFVLQKVSGVNKSEGIIRQVEWYIKESL